MENKCEKKSTILSDFDLFALTAIHECYLNEEECGTGKIVRGWFGNDNNDKHVFTRNNNFVLQRMLILGRNGWIKTKKNPQNKKSFTLNYKNVSVEKHKFLEKKVPSILIKDVRDKWMALEI